MQQAPLLAVNSLQGVFIHRGQDSATAVSGRKAQWSLKKALVPPLWLPHRCDVETSRNNNVDGENQDEGMGGWELSLQQSSTFTVYCRVAVKTRCANIYIRR